MKGLSAAESYTLRNEQRSKRNCRHGIETEHLLNNIQLLFFYRLIVLQYHTFDLLHCICGLSSRRVYLSDYILQACDITNYLKVMHENVLIKCSYLLIYA